MYDYLAKVILLGPSGAGKYVLLLIHSHVSFATVAHMVRLTAGHVYYIDS